MKNYQIFLIPLFILTVISCSPIHETIQRSTYSLDRVIEMQPGIDCHGRVTSLTVNTLNNKEIIAASESGGLFKTNDGGINWWHLDGLPTNYMMDVKYLPYDSTIVIATALADTKIENGGGIWISNNGGNSWHKSTLSIPINDVRFNSPNSYEKYSAYGISFDSNNNIYVGTFCGIAKSIDKGESWELIIPRFDAMNGERSQDRIWSVLPLPNNELLATSDAWIIRSSDGGRNWERKVSCSHSRNVWVTHGFTQSPYNHEYIFYTEYVGRLHYSLNSGIDWSQMEIPETPRPCRPSFIKSAIESYENNEVFNLYYSNGISLYSKMCFVYNQNSFNFSSPWQPVSVDHPDPSELITDHQSGFPLMLASDGGIHLTTNNGVSWRLASIFTKNSTGSFVNGLNALQIYDLTGQFVQQQPYPHMDLYFGTQDNYIWASSDSGKTWPSHDLSEGFFMNVPKYIMDEDGTIVTYVACWECFNIESEKHLLNPVEFYNCPAESRGAPFLCDNYKYIQYGDRNLFFTNNYSREYLTTWSNIARIENDLNGTPKIAKNGDAFVIYQGIKKSDILPDGQTKRGLIKIDGVNTENPSIVDADVNGFGSLGYYGEGFVCGLNTLGVNPANPNHLIMADISDNKMKHTSDGGLNWQVDENLTTAITDADKFVFRKTNGSTQARIIEFNPFNPQKIFVGTEQNGIIYTADNGLSWQRFPGSDRIVNITSIFFRNEYEAYVSSYGRGLWKMKFWNPSRVIDTLPTRFARPIDLPEMYSFSTGKQKSLHRKSIDSLNKCNDCWTLTVKGGVITNIDYDEDYNLKSIKISGGELVYRNLKKDSEKPNIIVSIDKDYGDFNKNTLLARLIAEKKTIEGIVLKNKKITDIICYGKNSTSSLKKIKPAYYNSLKEPYFRISHQSSSSGLTYVFNGGKINIEGRGFKSDQSYQVLLNGKVVLEKIVPDEKGIIESNFIINEIPGDYKLKIISLLDKKVEYIKTINVVPKDIR